MSEAYKLEGQVGSPWGRGGREGCSCLKKPTGGEAAVRWKNEGNYNTEKNKVCFFLFLFLWKSQVVCLLVARNPCAC